MRGPWSDPMVGTFLLDENSSDYSLGAVAFRYLDAPPWKDEFAPHREILEKIDYFPPAFTAPLQKYNSQDIYWTDQLDKFIVPRLQAQGLYNLYMIEMENLKTLARMTSWGIKIDTKKLTDWKEEYGKKCKVLEASVPFSIASSSQCLKALREAGYNINSTGSDVLKELSGDLPQRILEYRKCGKLLNTYLAGLEKVIHPDGRIHPGFHQTRTITGRLSSSAPNGQNFPRDTKDLTFRSLFTGTWNLLLCMDFNQLELRVAAWLSRDKALLDAYRTGKDIHDVTGERIWGKPASQITENERVVSKVTNFTALYDIFDSAYAAVKHQLKTTAGIEVTWADARRLVDGFRAAYPGWFREFIPSKLHDFYNQGWIRTECGRIRRSPIHIKAESFTKALESRDYWDLFRSVANTLDQGVATGDFIKVIATLIDKRLQRAGCRSRLCNIIHDEILIDIYPPERERVLTIARETATRPPTKELFGWDITEVIPLVVDIGVGENWSEAKKNKVH